MPLFLTSLTTAGLTVIILETPVERLERCFTSELAESVENGEQSEQFIDMFRNFIGIMNDKERVIIERENILQRAKLMNDIVNF